jgi:hypothetical protein
MYLAWACYAVLSVVVFLQIRVCKNRAEPIALLGVGLHALIYFTALTIDYRDGTLLNPLLWNAWSSTLRLHTVGTVASIEIFRLLRLRGGKHRGC